MSTGCSPRSARISRVNFRICPGYNGVPGPVPSSKFFLRRLHAKRGEELENSVLNSPAWEELRKKAERLLRRGINFRASGLGSDVLTLIHEAEVFHVELELQSEDLRKAKQELEASLRRYMDLYQYAPVAYITLNEKGAIVQVNHEATEMLGAPKRYLATRGLTRMIHPEDRDAYFGLFRGAKEQGTGKRKGCEIKVLSAGRILSAYAEMVSIYEEEKLSGWNIALIDLSPLRHAEEALRLSEQKYRSVFHAAKDALIVVDRTTGNILDVNSSACSLYGHSRDEFLTLREQDIIAGDSLPPAANRASDTRLGYHRKSDGTVFPVEIAISSHRQDNRPVSTLSVRDITQRKKAEDALESAYGELEESEGRLKYLSSRLLSIQEEERKRIAMELHDSIGQSLAAMKFGIEHALGTTDRTDSDSVYQILERTIPHIQKTIEEVRAIYTGLRPSMLDDLGILATIRWFCREFRNTYPKFHVDLEIELEEDVIPENLKIVVFRIMQEALNNIAKHSQAETASVLLVDHGDFFRLSVRDNGKGFDLETAADREIDTKGMGLASMRERTELSGGSFSISSASGRGTCIEAEWDLA